MLPSWESKREDDLLFGVHSRCHFGSGYKNLMNCVQFALCKSLVARLLLTYSFCVQRFVKLRRTSISNILINRHVRTIF